MDCIVYMVSFKEEVESITIVELEQSAIDFMCNLEDGQYEYCFTDIWIDIEDIQSYTDDDIRKEKYIYKLLEDIERIGGKCYGKWVVKA